MAKLVRKTDYSLLILSSLVGCEMNSSDPVATSSQTDLEVFIIKIKDFIHFR